MSVTNTPGMAIPLTSYTVPLIEYDRAYTGPDVEMNSGQQIRCRVSNGYMFIRDNNGQVRKAQIVDTGQPIQNRY